MKKTILFSLLCTIVLLSSCRNDDDSDIIGGGQESVTGGESSSIKGFYLLSEGQLGVNNATLDFFDAATGIYHTNIYPAMNPTVVKELGDTGNDIEIYKGRMYAVMNGSHKVTIMTADSARHIADVDIPNGRAICFDDKYAYVSSFVNGSWTNPDVLGAVFRFDLATLTVDSVLVGYQPEEMVIVDDKLYVANSGGVRSVYDNRVSVVDLNTFTLTKHIEVAPNLHRIAAIGDGKIAVSSRGNYYDVPSDLYVIDTHSDAVIDTLGIGVTSMCVIGDTLYSYCAEWSYETYGYEYAYNIVDLNTMQVSETQFITDGTTLVALYGLYINPLTQDVYLTDAGNYVDSGTIYCFDAGGKLKWSSATGICPAYIAFLQ